MVPNACHDVTNPRDPLDLSEQQIARLYKLTLEVRRALRRDVTPTAILHLIIGYGLAHAERQRDFAMKVPDPVARTPVQLKNSPRRATGGAGRKASRP
jgi:hypothetical protein